ncbi:TBC1 domain family member 24-like [Pygocentrus nattereri]|uniref:TBC1 domain family member 24 n=1 Tax=Pygocentrus nattereri TaxID=42514 RepID=A0A3B4DX33_PYGNA|nr:TBC1 domain family member 24-like [Pygocentrus nattereri]
MLQVSPSAEFACFGPRDLERVTTEDADAPSLASCGRLRSCSLYAPEDSGVINTDRNFRRPRSRSFYTLEPDDTGEDKASRSSADRQGLFQADTGKKDDGQIIHPKLPPKRSTATKHKHLKKDHAGCKGSLKSVPMLTISEPDSWEISSSSGMKYGQYVDWEKIDPESAIRYQEIISSDHAKLKELGRSGFWTMPHTLRAKAYHHIIHCIEHRASTMDTDTYRDLSGQLFEEQRTSTHPFPKFMENGEIPRYCLNKAGLNSVKKILLCISQNFPEITFCPILPALVSLLLHYSEDEAQCFHSICSLLFYTDPEKRYIDQTFLTTHASCMTFGDLANKYCRGIRKLIASSHQSLFEFYSDWIMWIFADLPFSYAIRVLDVYLIEGYKVLYRVALALLCLYKVSVSSRLAHVDDFRQDMKRFVQNVSRHSSIEALLQRAFSIQLPTRRELNFLYNANKQALIQRGIQNQSSYQSVELGGFCSSVVSETEMRVVWAWIPERFALFSPARLFSTTDHSRSLTSFYSRVEGHEPTVLLLKTVDEEVCGAFLSSDWTLRDHDGEKLQFFGTEECFVFTLRPGMERYQRTVLHISGMAGTSPSSSCSSSHPAGSNWDPKYLSVPFSPEPHLPKARFMAGGDEMLFIGGDGGHALSLFADLSVGQSEGCATFESPVLCRGKFRIQSLEVWGIQHTLALPHTPPHVPSHTPPRA